MGRMARGCAWTIVAIVGWTTVLTGTASASGRSCEQRVLVDWSDNGRVDGIYQLHCYQDALASMPSDLSDYTNAGDAIRRALTRATTKSSPSSSSESRRVAAGPGVAVAGPGPSALPLPLIGLAGVSVAVLAAGGLGWVARKRHTRGVA